jgi:hypothetical protein
MAQLTGKELREQVMDLLNKALIEASSIMDSNTFNGVFSVTLVVIPDLAVKDLVIDESARRSIAVVTSLQTDIDVRTVLENALHRISEEGICIPNSEKH